MTNVTLFMPLYQLNSRAKLLREQVHQTVSMGSTNGSSKTPFRGQQGPSLALACKASGFTSTQFLERREYYAY